MAKFNGANLRYNNSDDENRVYDLSAEVVVNDNKVEAVNITASKDGQYIGSANINGLGTETGNSSFNFSVSQSSPEVAPSVSVNFYGLPMEEHAGCIAEVYAFIKDAVENAAACGLDA
ncbi:hypothetical protein [uncultured Duncaniella sp.]|uniref:hypothetical protein n=1 Tax=uncultured Duncaniella sp. TaxID=2768039 RepID=UPI0025A9CB0D|nr:hypothetical protein [uncultured Duncaniella sp.]